MSPFFYKLLMEEGKNLDVVMIVPQSFYFHQGGKENNGRIAISKKK